MKYVLTLLIICISFSAVAWSDSSERISLKPYVGRLKTIDVSIAGRAHPFLFDTGGGLTTITKEVAEEIDCKPYGRIVAHRMNGDAVEFQKCDQQSMRIGSFIVDAEISVFDLMAMLPKNLPPLGGVISLHTFMNLVITIDLRRNELIVESEEALKKIMESATEVPVRIARPSSGAALDAFVGVKGNRGILWLELDSGNLDELFLAPHAWTQMTNVAEDEGTVPFTFGELPPVQLSARKKDLIYDGVLNAASIEKYLFTIDLKRGRLWMRPIVDTP